MIPEKRPRGRPKSQFKESSAGTLQALDRALTVLVRVSQGDSPTLSDLAREMEVPTATTHRILTTLQNHGFVSFDEARQEWRIGVEAYRTGAAFLSGNSVIEIGQSFLRKLMRTTGETANLAVPDTGHMVFVGQVEAANPIRAFFPPGTRTSMHASGTGKAILAAMSDAALDRVLSAMTLEGYTQHTRATRETLLRDLDQIRARGWSHDHEERHVGMSCIGAAIYDAGGTPHAGISVSGPSSRFSGDRLEALGDAVAQAARDITQLSGGQMPG
ncbi:MAG: IclR family transcriptional regulator [Pseudomonadota bacterium]